MSMLCIVLGRLDGLWRAEVPTYTVFEDSACINSKSPCCFWLKSETGLTSFAEENGEYDRQSQERVLCAGLFLKMQ